MNEIIIKLVLDDADRGRIDALTASIHRLADVLLMPSKNTEPIPGPVPLPQPLMDAAFNRFLAQQEQQTRLQQAAQAAGVLDPQPAAAPETTAVTPAVTPVTAATTPAVQAQAVPLPDFQAAIAKKCAVSPAMKAAVRNLVNQYAPSVSEIPEEKRAEVMQALSTLAV